MRSDNQMLRTINAQRGEWPWLDFLLACAGCAAIVVAVVEFSVRRLG